VDAVESKALQSIPFFAGLSQGDLRNIAAIGQTVAFGVGDAIVEAGQPGDAMYVVLSGSAEVDVGGRYHTLKAGDLFGEMALVSATRRLATVKAVEPLEALRIPADGFEAFLMANPAITVSILRAVVERLREVEQRIDAWIGTG
jgi:CRP-like cAMP-binding protein